MGGDAEGGEVVEGGDDDVEVYHAGRVRGAEDAETDDGKGTNNDDDDDDGWERERSRAGDAVIYLFVRV